MEKLDSDVLQDHEILEVLLFIALPRKNTNDIAHRLISEFGSVAAVFSAKFSELKKVEGVGPSLASFLVSIGKIYRKHFSHIGEGYRGVFDHHSFLSYVKNAYAAEKQEILDVYLLDEENVIVHRKRFTVSDELSVEVAPETLGKLLLEHSSAGVVFVHNHPKGKPEPSAADDRTTEKCQLLCSCHNVLFCDHYIYAPDGVYSYYLSGKLKNISEKYSMETVLRESDGKEGV